MACQNKKYPKQKWTKTAQVQVFSSAHRIWLGLYKNSTRRRVVLFVKPWSIWPRSQTNGVKSENGGCGYKMGPLERVENCWCLTIQNHQKKRGEKHYPTSRFLCIQIRGCFFKLTFYFFAKVKIIIKPPFGRICFELFSKHQTVANPSFVSGGLKVVFFRSPPENWGKNDPSWLFF